MRHTCHKVNFNPVEHISVCEMIEPQQLFRHIETVFDYDHEMGRLRWTTDPATLIRLVPSLRLAAGNVVFGTTSHRGYDYGATVAGNTRSVLPIIWQHQTGERRTGIMAIKPGETRFSIDNLCVIPRGSYRTPSDRAKGSVVVSWSYEYKKFTVVEVDDDYNKTVLSYHADIKSAFKALDNPVLSFV